MDSFYMLFGGLALLFLLLKYVNRKGDDNEDECDS